MTTPTGTISLSNVNVELGKASTTNITMNNADVRTLAGKASGAISMSDLRGKSSNTVATGGTITTTGGYRYHTFKSNGTFTVTSGTGNIDVLIVAGGGGANNSSYAPGGGAGGMLELTYAISAISRTVTIGAGGAGTGGQATGRNGGNTSVTGLTTAIGGGGGQYDTAVSGGGSGGGSFWPGAYYGPGTAGQGNGRHLLG